MSFVALSALQSPSLFLTGDFHEPRVPERFVMKLPIIALCVRLQLFKSTVVLKIKIFQLGNPCSTKVLFKKCVGLLEPISPGIWLKLA